MAKEDIAVVTRTGGIGKDVALALGMAGATVYADGVGIHDAGENPLPFWQNDGVAPCYFPVGNE